MLVAVKGTQVQALEFASVLVQEAGADSASVEAALEGSDPTAAVWNIEEALSVSETVLDQVAVAVALLVHGLQQLSKQRYAIQAVALLC